MNEIVKPVRLRLSRAKGFNLQAASLANNGLPAVNVGRPSRWGNPFRIGGWFRMGDDHPGPFRMSYMQCLSDKDEHRIGYTELVTAAEAVDWFSRYKQANPMSAQQISALQGRNLACWCALDAPCHADVLLDLANPYNERSGR